MDMQRIVRAVPCIIILVFCHQCEASDDEIPEPGHLEKIGNHRPSLGHVEIVEHFPDPTTFYETYVKPNKPVLMKGAAKQLPAFDLWTDTYLRQKYGEIVVDVEMNKKEDRTQYTRQIKLETFLNKYSKMNIYMVQDVFHQMLSELGLPKLLQCGGFEDQISMMVVWMSSGGTKSVLHHDDVDNINCVLDGSKRFILIDKTFKDHVEAAGWQKSGSYSLVDVDSVDMKEFPRFAEVDWTEAIMEKGDCLYLPYELYHAVETFEGRSLAVNYWFTHPFWFNVTDCENSKLSSIKPLNPEKLPFLDIESADIEHLRFDIFRHFEGKHSIAPEDFTVIFKDLDEKTPEYVEYFKAFDTNKDAVISWEEVYAAEADIVMNFGILLFGEAEENDNERDEL